MDRFADGELKKVPTSGGAVASVAKVSGTPVGASWSDDGEIVFATSDYTSGLLSVPAEGGNARVLTKPTGPEGAADHRFPYVLPGGRAILFTETVATQQLHQSRLAVLERRDGVVQDLRAESSGTHPAYVDGVGLVFWADGALRAMDFSPSQLGVSGESRSILAGMALPFFDVSRSGTLVSSRGGRLRAARNRLLVWVNSQGREEPVAAPPRPYASYRLRVSPDGEQLVTDIGPAPTHIWVWHFGRQTLTRVTSGPQSNDLYPLWTPDAREIAFSSSTAGGQPSLARIRADGASPAISMASSNALQQFPLSFTPDGRTLVFRQARAGEGVDLFVMPFVDHGTARPLFETPFAEFNAAISPDGRWIAFDSNASGRFEVYVRPFPT